MKNKIIKVDSHLKDWLERSDWAGFTIFALGFLAILAMLFSVVDSGAATIDQDLIESRYTNKVIRLGDGSIRRRADVISAFRKVHPCPSTMQFSGACPGYAINHVIPLACGGRDQVSNMMWLRNELKSCAADTGRLCVDRYERKINALTPAVADTANCINQLVP